MTCVWTGLMQGLTANDKKMIGTNSAVNFVKWLKQKNCKTTDVKWNGQNLTSLQLKENMEAIKELKINTIQRGYFCSTFEPFIFLYAQLFTVNVSHNYMGHMMKYTNYKAKRTVYLTSSAGHLSFVKSV